jgi:hypothetical protein
MDLNPCGLFDFKPHPLCDLNSREALREKLLFPLYSVKQKDSHQANNGP